MHDHNMEGVTILHLSDIHRTKDEPVTNQNIISALTADLQRQQQNEGLPKPDFLVISGDITQAAQEDEYSDAYNLVERLIDELSVPNLSRVILVPGNHDINWDISETLFKVGSRKPAKIDEDLLHNGGSFYLWTNEETYVKRLGPFREFYRRVYNRQYGASRRDQYDIWPFPDLGICFVGLNSCDRLDHLRFQGAIYEEELFAANESLKEMLSTDLEHFLKIAVWHHDINWLGRSEHADGLEPSILGHLVDAGYDLALCGHTHRPNFNNYTYPGFHLPIVAAGSLCAGPRQREESIPRLYNLIHIQGKIARVHTRSRETKDSPWRPYTHWGTPPCSHFDVPLGKQLRQPRQDRSRGEVDTAPAYPAIPDEYYTKLIRDFEYLDIAGIDNERAIPLKLSEVYVKLRVIPGEDEEEQAEGGELEETSKIDIHTALKYYRQLVIVGDPGSGKSTFLKFISLILSRAKIENDVSLAGTELNLQKPLPIPIFISLWDLSDYIKRSDRSDDNTILDYIVEQLASFEITMSTTEVKATLSDGKCYLLFDGLDEVPTEAGRALISRLVEAFVGYYPDNRYVITSRVRGYTGGAILRGNFRRCDIQDFDLDDIQHFARNWFCSLLNVAPIEIDGSNTRAYQEYHTLISAVSAPRVRLLAVNPLLMTVIAIVHWNRKRLPEQRVELYDECIDVLLGQRETAKGIKIEVPQTVDQEAGRARIYERKWTRKRFSEIAVSIMRQEQEEEITKERVIEILTDPFMARLHCNREDAQIEAEIFLDHQELRSGLLVSRRSRSYRFIHLTFQEYLAAWGLAARNDFWSIVQSHLHEQKWFETLQLLGGEFAQSSDDKMCEYLDLLMGEMGESIEQRAPVIALCANIVRDTEGIADLKDTTREKYEEALRSTLGVFSPTEKVPENTQQEVLDALAGLGRSVKAQLISATKSQYRSLRSKALELLCPHLPDDDIFAMTHIFEDKSKETIKTYLLALLERDEGRAKQVLGSIEIPPAKLSDALNELELLYVLPSFERVVSFLQSFSGATADGFLAELIRRDEAKTAALLKDPLYSTGQILQAVSSLKRIDLFDDDSLFSMIPGKYEEIREFCWGDEAVEVIILYAQAAIERDENRFRAKLQNRNYLTEPILQAVSGLKRIDLFDDDCLFSIILELYEKLGETNWSYEESAPMISYVRAAIERDENRFKAELQSSGYRIGHILGAIVELERLDLFDDDCLFSIIPELHEKLGETYWWYGGSAPMVSYVRAAIERDENRFKAELQSSDYLTWPILGAIVELERLDLFDDDSLFSMMHWVDYLPTAYVQAAIERDENRFKTKLQSSKYRKVPILAALVKLERLDLLDDDCLFSTISIVPALGAYQDISWKPEMSANERREIFYQVVRIVRYHYPYWEVDLGGAILSELYRRDPAKTITQLRDSEFSVEISRKTPFIVGMLTSESGVLRREWLLAARIANCLDLLDRFSDESIIEVIIDFKQEFNFDEFFWNMPPPNNPNVRQRFIGIARRLIELGHANIRVQRWLDWACQEKPVD